MARNRKFKNQYMVTIDGTTSNGYQAQLFDTIIRAVCRAFGVNSQQSTVKVSVIETDGDYDAEKQRLKPEPRIEQKASEAKHVQE